MKTPIPILQTRSGTLTPYAFACGYIERYGEHVRLGREHGAYVIRRNPRHPAGSLVQGCRTLTEARRIARAAAKDLS